MSRESGYLFAGPSFVEGVGRLLDFGGALSQYNYAHSPEEADQMALTMDWEAVGREITTATRSLDPAR